VNPTVAAPEVNHVELKESETVQPHGTACWVSLLQNLRRLHRAVSVTILRNTASQRHVRMNAKPTTIGLPRQYDCGPAWTVERTSIFMKNGARPGRYRDCHRAIR
jgi:hypothetical protein